MLPSATGFRAFGAGARAIPGYLEEPQLSQPESPLRKVARTPTLWIVLITVGFMIVVSSLGGRDAGETLTTSEFRAMVAAGEIENAKFLEGDQVITGEYEGPSGTYRVQYLAESSDELEKLLDDAGVPYDSDPQLPNTLISTLITVILPVVLIAGVLLWVMNRSQGGGGRVMQFGRSRHKTVAKDQPKTTFADVAGVDEAIEELEEVKEYLQSPAKFQAMGAKIPRGVLLFGPPGTGQDAARARRGRRGRRAVLLDQRLGLRGDVRRRGRRARPRPVRAGEGVGSRDRVHRRDRRRRAVTAVRDSAEATTSASRRSTSCSWRWTASISARPSS